MSQFNSLSLQPPTLSTPHQISSGKDSNLGCHDALRYGLKNVKTEIQGAHPLESRLENWDESQRKLKLSMYRQTFGSALPIQLEMERFLVQKTDLLIPVVKTHNLGMDILEGRDESIDFDDYLGDIQTPLVSVNPHAAMERKWNISF